MSIEVGCAGRAGRRWEAVEVLKQDVNELLTRTGPGTDMGALFRRYWIPALLAEELPEDGCPPVEGGLGGHARSLSRALAAWWLSGRP